MVRLTKTIGFIAAAAFLLPAPVAALQGDSQKAAAAEPSADANNDVCKRITQSGTRIKKRICMRQSAWDQLARQSEEMGRDMVNKGQRGNLPES